MGLFERAEDKRYREALDWVQTLHGDDVSEAQIASYVDWMEADPLNAEVFRRLDEAWVISADAKDAIRAVYGPEARSVHTGGIAKHLKAFVRPGFTPQFAAATAALLLLMLAVLPTPDTNTSVQRYVTAIGETRDVTLEDDSVVTLNTNSEISVSYEYGVRRVSIGKGGALFEVASDAERPFIVHVNGGMVRVLGTVFDVLESPAGFTVTVLEGRVSVAAGDNETNGAVLEPNQRAEVNTRVAALTTFAVDADAASAWRRGQLIYRNAPLSDVMTDLNRYSSVPLTLGNDAMGDMEFTGVLSIAAPNLMMERLAGLLSMNVVESEDGALILDSFD